MLNSRALADDADADKRQLGVNRCAAEYRQIVSNLRGK